MDKTEARAVAQQRLAELRDWPYAELVALEKKETVQEVTGPSGVSYTVESQGIWDHRKQGHLRVMVAIDDGGLRAFSPLTDDFIIAPDGTFIDE